MKIKSTVVPVKGGFEDKIRQMIKAQGEGFEAGWFEEQGLHENTDMTYPELAYYHASGGDGQGIVVQRDILRVTNAVYPIEREQAVHRLLGQWMDNPTEANLAKLLDDLGEHTVYRIKSLFGSGHLHPTAGNPDPLVDTGELRDNTAYKTTKNPTYRLGKV